MTHVSKKKIFLITIVNTWEVFLGEKITLALEMFCEEEIQMQGCSFLFSPNLKKIACREYKLPHKHNQRVHNYTKHSEHESGSRYDVKV